MHCKPNKTHTTKKFNKINEDLDQITEWSKKNGLSLNGNKSRYKIIGKSNRTKIISNNIISFILKNENIKRVTEARNFVFTFKI